MDFDKLPSKPVVKSSISAQQEWDDWLLQNKFDVLRDGDGLDWSLVLQAEFLPSEKNPRMGMVVLHVHLGCDVPVNMLIDTGTLDRLEDERLIKLVGSAPVPLRMRPMRYETSHEASAQELIRRILPELRENFRKLSLHTVKKDLIGRWVDELSEFGQREQQKDFAE